MTRAGLMRLVGQNVRRSMRTLLLSSMGIVLGIGAFSFFLALREGVRTRVLEAIFPVDRIEVVPRIIILHDPNAPDAGELVLPKPGEPIVKRKVERKITHIDDAMLDRLRAHAGVAEIVPKQRVEVPVKAVLDIPMLTMFGVEPFPLDLPIEGLPADSVRDEAYGDKFVDLPANPTQADLDRPVPVVLSRFAIEMYDGTFAPLLGLPPFSKLIEKLGGLEGLFSLLNIEIVVGDGVIRAPMAEKLHQHFRIQVIGLSDKAVKLGASVPMGYAKRWNRIMGETPAQRYSSVIVIAQSKSQVGQIASYVRKELGLDIDDGDAVKFAFILDVVSALLVVVAFIIMTTAAINIGHVFFLLVAEREREIGVLRAVGASRGDITGMVLGEATLLGIFGGALGLLGALGASVVSNWIAAAYLPNFPFKPDSFFTFRWWIFAAGFGFAVVFCVLGAWLPARRAARMDPAAALAQG